MYGLEAITAANGWAMALAGAMIVLSGLAVLAIVISQLHKAIALVKKPTSVTAEKTEISSAADLGKDESIGIADRDLLQIEAAVAAYTPLIERLEQPFELKSLYALSNAEHYPHTHLTIKNLRAAGTLNPLGGGLFNWNPHGTQAVE